MWLLSNLFSLTLLTYMCDMIVQDLYDSLLRSNEKYIRGCISKYLNWELNILVIFFTIVNFFMFTSALFDNHLAKMVLSLGEIVIITAFVVSKHPPCI